MGYRSDLRARTIAAIVARNVAPAASVYDSRKIPLERDELRAISVFTLGEDGAGSNPFMTSPEFQLSVRLTIEAEIEGKDDATLALQIDNFCDEICAAIFTTPAWVSEVQGIDNFSIDFNLDAKSDKRTAGATIGMDVALTKRWEPVIPDRLEKIHVKVDVIDPAADPNLQYPGPDGRIEVEAEFEIDT